MRPHWFLLATVASGASTLAKAPSNERPEPTEVFDSIRFEPNVGQADTRFGFIGRSSAQTIFVSAGGVALALRRTGATASDHAVSTLETRFVGVTECPSAEPLDELPGKVHYLIGNSPRSWKRHVPTYARVRYRDVYPGIDVVYYTTGGRLEYDLVVAPGSDPDAIEIRFDGAAEVRIEPDGELSIVLSGGSQGVVRQGRPRAYQEAGGFQHPVEAEYVLHDTNSVGLRFGDHDSSRPLVIDPVLNYSTYFGGRVDDFALALALDDRGNAYLTGVTGSLGLATPGAFQRFPASLEDAFIAKLDPTGTEIVYTTYLGGGERDGGTSIDVDQNGSAYIVGLTRSSDFPTERPLQPALLGDQNAFVAKLCPDGSCLVYSTYLGGSGHDVAWGLAVDDAGAAYVVGVTASMDFPLVDAFQGGKAGAPDAFVTKLNPSGSALVFSTYIGGRNEDIAAGVAVDSTGRAVVAGGTYSVDFPLRNPFQSDRRGLCSFFVTRFEPHGADVVYSTYLGGTECDAATGVATDPAGYAYVVGSAVSADFPLRNPVQATSGGSIDPVVSVLDPAGQLTSSTYLGGSNQDFGLGIAVDQRGDIYVTGTTGSSDFPTVAAFQPAIGGRSDAFVAKIDPRTPALVYSSYLGGSDTDDNSTYLAGIAVDSCGRAFLAGNTLSTDFPVTPGALQTRAAGATDGFFARVGTAAITCPPDATVECPGSTEPDETGFPQPTGFCSPPTCTYVDAETPTCGGLAAIARTWTCTDGIDSPTCVQGVESVDTTAPAIRAVLEPLPPRPARSTASACSAPSSGTFAVGCGADDACDPAPAIDAALLVTKHEVASDGSCTARVESLPVACGEVVELRLLAPPCPAKPPRSPQPALSVDSRGVKTVSGEKIVLEVSAVDACGNRSEVSFDPAEDPSPACDVRLPDGTCCPALAAPPASRCRLPPCRDGSPPPHPARSRHGRRPD